MIPPVHPVPPAPTQFVIARSPHAYQRELRRVRIQIATQVATLVIQLAAATALAAMGSITGLALILPIPLSALALVLHLRTHQAHAAMRNLQVIFTADGVTYASEAGTFTAPWKTVTRINLRRGRWISVRVPHWNGPISGFGLFGELVLPLAGTGLNWEEVRHAVHYFSQGTVTPQ
ncbi:hypothetical protein [Saccharopolyspora griseoalba]|uniref:DUF2244 domain-containing protein n=1 Tax=Saccharopolyspora griseoalba TaxID=1431848 RepID=A0ABW2LSU7_9PSEU